MNKMIGKAPRVFGLSEIIKLYIQLAIKISAELSKQDFYHTQKLIKP